LHVSGAGLGHGVGQEPPQSTPLSLPFRSLSLQLGAGGVVGQLGPGQSAIWQTLTSSRAAQSAGAKQLPLTHTSPELQSRCELQQPRGSSHATEPPLPVGTSFDSATTSRGNSTRAGVKSSLSVQARTPSPRITSSAAPKDSERGACASVIGLGVWGLRFTAWNADY